MNIDFIFIYLLSTHFNYSFYPWKFLVNLSKYNRGLQTNRQSTDWDLSCFAFACCQSSFTVVLKRGSFKYIIEFLSTDLLHFWEALNTAKKQQVFKIWSPGLLIAIRSIGRCHSFSHKHICSLMNMRRSAHTHSTNLSLRLLPGLNSQVISVRRCLMTPSLV